MTALRNFATELAHGATELRALAMRAVIMQARVEALQVEAQAWELRLARAHRLGNQDLMIGAAKMCGRVAGELDAARRELVTKLDDEIALRWVLVEQRRKWMMLAEKAETNGLDISTCLLHIDLSRPEPPDDIGMHIDEEREWIARVIDRAPAN